jgi:hypothetical protein
MFSIRSLMRGSAIRPVNRPTSPISQPAIEVMEGRMLLSASAMHGHHDRVDHDQNDNKAVHVNAKHDKVDNDKNDDDAQDQAEVHHNGKDNPKGHH